MADARLAPFRGPALAFAAYLGVSATSGAVLFVLKLGARLETVEAFYRGSERTFAAPRTLGGILAVAVPHLVAVPLVLFAASHLVGFARVVGPRAFRGLAALSFGSALLGILAGFGVRFVAPGLAAVKLGAFVGLELGLLGWAALLVRLFWPLRSRARIARGAADRVARAS